MTSVFSWRNSVSLCPASFCTPRPNLPVTPGNSYSSFPTVLLLAWGRGVHQKLISNLYCRYFGPLNLYFLIFGIKEKIT